MKIKVITILTVIMILLMHVNVYADITIPNPPTDEDGWDYWVITSHPDYGFRYIRSQHPITITTDERYLVLDTYRTYIYKDNQWEYKETGFDEVNYSIYQIYQSNHDIAYSDGSGFFFLRPKVRQLSQAVKEMDFGTILRNFSVGLIPLIGLLILVISFKKAWEFLRSQLIK